MLQENTLFVVFTTNLLCTSYYIFDHFFDYKYNMIHLFGYAKSSNTLSKI